MQTEYQKVIGRHMHIKSATSAACRAGVDAVPPEAMGLGDRIKIRRAWAPLFDPVRDALFDGTMWPTGAA
jgi:hypothetical protein